MKKTTCAHCKKIIEKRDSFRLSLENIPLWDDLSMMFKDLCLACYRQSIKQISKDSLQANLKTAANIC